MQPDVPSLRDQLIAAKISGAKTGQGYEFRTNENAADVAVGVVAAWLREEADQRRKFAYRQAGNDYLLDQADVIEALADSLVAQPAQPDTEETRTDGQ